MTPSQLREKVVTERVAWIRTMVRDLQDLPLASQQSFFEDRRNIAAAESYVRRALEALFDLGRHLLAKGFGTPATEYKQIAQLLQISGVLDAADAERLERMAGYRNRMVHFYNAIGAEELYELATRRVADLEKVLESMLSWVRNNPDRIDHSL